MHGSPWKIRRIDSSSSFDFSRGNICNLYSELCFWKWVLLDCVWSSAIYNIYGRESSGVQSKVLYAKTLKSWSGKGVINCRGLWIK